MGLNIHTLKMFFDSVELLEINSLYNKSICELGNLYIRKCIHPYLKKNNIPIFKTAKQLFMYLGMQDVSLDWNGKDGALIVDLGKPIKNLGPFDFVINGGTAEHVYDQYECWKNIHNLCRDGGLVVSIGPLAGNWLKHSPWRYSLEFFDCLCFKNNYDLLERKIVNFKNRKGFDCHYISFRKNKGDFILKDTFIKIWNNHQKEKING